MEAAPTGTHFHGRELLRSRLGQRRDRITARQIGYRYASTVIDLPAGAIDTLLVRMHAERQTLY